jgi:hypothetical protein
MFDIFFSPLTRTEKKCTIEWSVVIKYRERDVQV